MAVINVNDAYILDNTGKQVDDAVDYALANSNRNLLDNWYFVGGGSQLGDGVFPINQRGQTSYTSYGWALDRWICGGNTSVTLTQSGVTVASSAYDNNFLQKIEPNLYNALVGKTVTLSILATSLSGAWNVGLGNTVLAQFTNAGMLTVTATVPTQAQDTWKIISFSGAANSSITIAAIKLELGSYSTLANDVPPDFGEELRKCQRYLWIKTFSGNTQIGSGVALTADQAIVSVVTPASMRPAQNITLTANVLLVGNGQVATASSITGINQYDNIARLTLSSSGLTAHHTYSFFTTIETTMAIYAEL